MDDEIPMLVSQEDSDLVPELAPLTLTRQNLSRVPITLITGFLGSGKVCMQYQYPCSIQVGSVDMDHFPEDIANEQISDAFDVQDDFAKIHLA